MRRAIVAALAASSSLAVWAQEPPAVVTPLDPLARYIRAGGPLTDADGGRIELLIDGDAAAVRVQAGGRTEVAPVADVSDALALLADPRAAAIWPALTEWAGADLSSLRERRLAQARRDHASGGADAHRSGNVTESAVRERVRALMRYASALAASGRRAEGFALLARERDALPYQRRLASHGAGRAVAPPRGAALRSRRRRGRGAGARSRREGAWS